MNTTELRQAIAQLPEPVTTLRPPHWEYWRRELWHHLKSDDPNNFMGWPCLYHTMLVNHWDMKEEWEYLQPKGVNFAQVEKWSGAIKVHTGIPQDNFKPWLPYSNNMINQAYHIALWENTTGKRIDQLDSIIEFGGGYGAMALLCWRLGFRGKYTIYDLPEFSLLQQWFLSQEGVDNVTWPKRQRMVEADLLIALYSLSEIPLTERSRFLSKTAADNYLFLYSPTWESYDNTTYFQQFADGVSMNWHTQTTPRDTDYYLMGWQDANR